MRHVPVKGTVSQAKGNDTYHLPLGARRCSRTSSRTDAWRRRTDAPPLRHRGASLRHSQMPRRLSPLPGARLQQGSRRMEPDGALLQLHTRSQHYGLRALRCMRRQGASVAPGRVWSSHGPPPDRPAEVFGAHHALVRTPSIPTAFARLIAEFLPSLDGQITSCFPKWLVQPLLQKYFASHLRKISSLSRTVPSRKRGVAHVTNAGRDAVDAAARVTNGADADGEVVSF